jgi:hypothetical protein
MAKLNRIESMESFPMDQRLFMVYSLGEGSLTLYKEGRDAKDAEIGTALWLYHNALNEAEAQIQTLLELLKKQDMDHNEMEEYLERFPDSDVNYLIQETKAELFIAMAKEDQKAISKLTNKLLIIQEKEAYNG